MLDYPRSNQNDQHSFARVCVFAPLSFDCFCFQMGKKRRRQSNKRKNHTHTPKRSNQMRKICPACVGCGGETRASSIHVNATNFLTSSSMSCTRHVTIMCAFCGCTNDGNATHTNGMHVDTNSVVAATTAACRSICMAF